MLASGLSYTGLLGGSGGWVHWMDREDATRPGVRYGKAGLANIRTKNEWT